MYKSKTALEKEVSSLKEANQIITMKLNTAENKMSSLEAEVFIGQRKLLSSLDRAHAKNNPRVTFLFVVTNSEYHAG